MIEITAEIRALIDKAAAGMELAGDEYIDPADGLSVNWSGHRAQAAFLFSPYIQLSERLPPNSFV